MVWTLRRILVLIVFTSTLAVVGTLIWVTATYQRFAIDTQNEVSGQLVSHLVHQRVQEEYLEKIGPFIDEWSRFSVLVRGMQELSQEKARLAANRIMYTLEATSGRIRLQNVVIYSKDLRIIAAAEKGTGDSVRASKSIWQRIQRQGLREQRMMGAYLWRTKEGRPLHSAIAPIGGFKVAGFIEFVTDPVPELAGLGGILGGKFDLRNKDGETLFRDGNGEAVLKANGVSETAPDPAFLEQLTVDIQATSGEVWAIASLTRDTSAFRTAVFQLRDKAIVILALVVLASVLFGWLLLRLSVFRQLAAFATAMESLAGGFTQFTSPKTGPDEFSTMRSALELLKVAVTERKEAELKLTRGEEQLQLVIDNSPVGVTIERDDGVRWFVNQRQVDNFAANSKEELLALNTAESFVDLADRARLRAMMNQEGRNAYAGELVRRRRLDGSLWWASMTKVPFELEGRPAEIVWLQDMTDTIESQRSAALLTEAIDNLPDMVTLFDREERVVFTNNRYHEIYPDAPPKSEIVGWQMENLLIRSLQTGKIGHPLAATDPEAWLQSILQRRRSHVDYIGETSHPDGRTYEIRHRRTKEGGMILFQSDITSRKEAEEQIRRSEEELQTVVDNMPVGIAVFGPDKSLNLWNTTYCALLGFNSDELMLNTSYEDFAQYCENQFGHSAEEGTKPYFDYHDEALFPDTRTMREVTYSSGRQHLQGITQPIEGFGWIRILVDISERKQAEEQVKLSQDRLRAIIDNSPDAIYLKDHEGKYTLVNRAIAERESLTTDEMIGMTAHSHFPAELADDVLSHEREVLATGLVIEREVAIDLPGRPPYIGLTTKFPVEDADGNVSAVGTITYNITERKRAEQAAEEARQLAEEANRAKSDFLSSMSHELRTPLNAIIGFSEFVAEDQENPISPEQLDCMSQVLRAGNHLLTLIDEVLDLAKIEAGALALTIEPINVMQVIDECLSLTNSLAAQQDISLHERTAGTNL